MPTFRFVSLLRSNPILALTICIACFAGTYFFCGFYYTDYEGFFGALFSGRLTPGSPFRSIYFINNIGISYLYTYLYTICPDIEWFSWIYSFYTFVASYIGIYLLAALLPRSMSFIFKVFLLIATYVLVFSYSQMHFNCTYISYMGCGFSLIALIFFFKSVHIRYHLLLFVLLNLLFTVCVLIKVEAGTAVLSLMVFLAAFHLRDIRRFAALFAYPVLLVLALSVGISWDIRHSSEFYKQIEPDIESQFQNRNNKVPLSFMKTRRDTILYRTASDIVWSDPQIISPAFLRSLILPERPLFTDGRQWSRVVTDISSVIDDHLYLVFISLLLAAGIWAQYDFKQNRFSIYLWLVFEIAFWLLICVQDYIYKLNERSFLPYLSLFIFCHIILLAANIGRRISARVYMIASFLFIGLLFHISHLISESRNLKNDLRSYQSDYGRIKQIASGRYLVLNSSSIDYICLSNTPFHPFDFSAFKKVYVTDGSIIPFIPDYRRFLQKECGCDMYAYPSFYDFLRSIHSDVVIVSSPSRMDIIQTYLREIHQYTLPVMVCDSCILRDVHKAEDRRSLTELKVYSLGP